MDAFEQLVGEILWAEGYWVRTSVKVNLTKEEKRAINRPTSPRWEIDIVAYCGRSNVLLVVECKSYLNSRGVTLGAFDGRDVKFGKRFKLFSDGTLRSVVLNRLRHQFFDSGACQADPKVMLGLACGRIATTADQEGLKKYFKERGWELFDNCWLRDGIKKMADSAYENHIPAVVVKLLNSSP